jgi:hypothetical protein
MTTPIPSTQPVRLAESSGESYLEFLDTTVALGRGNKNVPPQDGRHLYRSAAREIGNWTPWWRRLLGAAHPYIWLQGK